MVVKKCKDINARDNQGNTPLGVAMQLNFREMVLKYFKNCPDVDPNQKVYPVVLKRRISSNPFNAGFIGNFGFQAEESDIEDDGPVNEKNGKSLYQCAMSNNDKLMMT